MFHKVMGQLRDIVTTGKNLPIVDRIMKTGKVDLNRPIDKCSKQTLLMQTVSQGVPDAVRKLLEFPIDLYATDVSGRNVFHYACASDKTENFKVLLEYVKNEGSDPDYEELTEARTIGGLTPMMVAVQNGGYKTLVECVNNSFNIFAKDKMGNDCWTYAK